MMCPFCSASVGQTGCCPGHFPFLIFSVPSIIWRAEAGLQTMVMQGCIRWPCRFKFTQQKILEQSRKEQHSSNSTPFLPLGTEMPLVNYQNIEILRNSTKSGEKTSKQASLSFFPFWQGDLLERGDTGEQTTCLIPPERSEVFRILLKWSKPPGARRREGFLLS